MPPLVPVAKILKKMGSPVKFGSKQDQTFKGSDRKKCLFLYFGNLQHQAFAIFGELRGSIKEISPIGEKKIYDHRRKPRKNYKFLKKQSPFLGPNFIRGSTVVHSS